jgi:hypothetical protein
VCDRVQGCIAGDSEIGIRRLVSRPAMAPSRVGESVEESASQRPDLLERRISGGCGTSVGLRRHAHLDRFRVADQQDRIWSNGVAHRELSAINRHLHTLSYLSLPQTKLSAASVLPVPL